MKRNLATLLVLMSVVVADVVYAQHPDANTHEHREKSLGQAFQKAHPVETDANEDKGLVSAGIGLPGDSVKHSNGEPVNNETEKEAAGSSDRDSITHSPAGSYGRKEIMSPEKAMQEINEWLEDDNASKKGLDGGPEKNESKKDTDSPPEDGRPREEVAPDVQKKALDTEKRRFGTGPVETALFGYPERKNYIRISKTDVNRFVCENGDVTGTIFSEDKGIEVKKSGRNAFLRIRPDSFAFEHPFEFYVMCDEELYTFIIEGEWISASRIVLKDGGRKVEEALDFFKGKDRELNVVEVVRKSWNDKWEEGWREIPRFRTVKQTKDCKTVWYKTVETGTPWVLEMFIVEGLGQPVKLKEEDFLDGDVIAVSCLDPLVARGRMGKVVVIREKASHQP